MTHEVRTAAPPGPPPPGTPWTVIGMIRWSAAWLAERGVGEPRLSCEHLLAHVLGRDRLGLYLEFDRPLAPDELAHYKPLLRRRARHEPIQYILGTTAFRDLELRTDARALIPRPETEGLVQVVLDEAALRGMERGALLDVGTGTGAIALAAWSEGPFARVVAVDRSPSAVALARENADRVGADVDMRQGAFFAALEPGETFDVVVSNPPYVADHEMDGLPPDVGAWEPAEALRGGPSGLDVITPLLTGAPAHLRPGGFVALEIGATQGSRVLQVAVDTPGLADARLLRDLAGRDRYLVANRA